MDCSSIYPCRGDQSKIYSEQGAHAGLIRSYFRFSINKAIRKVLFLGILDQRSYKGLILNATELFQILYKFSCKDFFLTFSNQQTYAYRFKSAFLLFDKTLCTKMHCLDLTHSKMYYDLNFEGARS